MLEIPNAEGNREEEGRQEACQGAYSFVRNLRKLVPDGAPRGMRLDFYESFEHCEYIILMPHQPHARTCRVALPTGESRRARAEARPRQGMQGGAQLDGDGAHRQGLFHRSRGIERHEGLRSRRRHESLLARQIQLDEEIQEPRLRAPRRRCEGHFLYYFPTHARSY